MKIGFALISLLLLGSATLCAQPYVEGGETRHRFAQTYVGAGVDYIPAGGSVWNDIAHDAVPHSAVVAPVLSIGGLHFWGHADFYVRFPLATIAVEQSGPDGFMPGVRTGAKLFPWRMEIGTVRPYLGFDWSVFGYGSGNGPVLYGHRVQPQAGLVWMTPGGIVDAGVRLMPAAAVSYPISPMESREVSLPSTTFTLGYSFPFETTISAEPLAQSGREQVAEKWLAGEGKLDGATVGAGFSSAFTATRTKAAGREISLDLPVPPAVFPEVNLGYYHHGLDAAANIMYRSIDQEQEGYGLQQQWSRRALSVEGIKFIADYNGFVPFVGAMVSYNSLAYSEQTSDGRHIDESKSGWSAGVVAGWDIRPNRLNWFTIRTAVRYTPALDIDLSGDARATFDHLEVNFFQFVVYPTRLFR